MDWLIYTLRSPRTKQIRYVGVTTKTPGARLQQHIYDSIHHPSKTYRNRWILSLFSIGLIPEIEVIESGSGGGWSETERRWIAFYRNSGCQLANATDGGEGVVAWGTPALRSAAALKREAKKTPEERKAISDRIKAAIQPGQRSAAAKRQRANMTPEEKTKVALRMNSFKTFDQRRATSLKMHSSMTAERRSDIARKRSSNITAERRSAIAKKKYEMSTPAQRVAFARAGGIAQKGLSKVKPRNRESAQ